MKVLVVALIVVVSLLGASEAGFTGRYGRPSAKADDAQSSVYCLSGERMLSCGCNTGSTCDGAKLELIGGRLTCTAFNRGTNGVTQAVAKCGQVILRNTGYKVDPRYTCPNGLKMEVCTIANTWSYKVNKNPSFDWNYNSCWSTHNTCSLGRGCDLYALCVDTN